MRGPIKGSPWGIVEIDGKRYAGIYSTSYWTEADLAAWESRYDIIRAARERVPQIPGRQLHQKYFYSNYLTSEEKEYLEMCNRARNASKNYDYQKLTMMFSKLL